MNLPFKRWGDIALAIFVVLILLSLFLWTEFTDGGYYDNTGRENRHYQNEVIINER